MLFLSDVSVQSTLWVNENFFIDAVDAKSDKEPNSFHERHKNNKEVYLENLHGINSIISMWYKTERRQ